MYIRYIRKITIYSVILVHSTQLQNPDTLHTHFSSFGAYQRYLGYRISNVEQDLNWLDHTFSYCKMFAVLIFNVSRYDSVDCVMQNTEGTTDLCMDVGIWFIRVWINTLGVGNCWHSNTTHAMQTIIDGNEWVIRQTIINSLAVGRYKEYKNRFTAKWSAKKESTSSKRESTSSCSKILVNGKYIIKTIADGFVLSSRILGCIWLVNFQTISRLVRNIYEVIVCGSLYLFLTNEVLTSFKKLVSHPYSSRILFFFQIMYQSLFCRFSNHCNIANVLPVIDYSRFRLSVQPFIYQEITLADIAHNQKT